MKMNLKKIFLGFIVMLGVIGLTACGNDTRKEFTKALYTTSNQDFNAAKFNMSIKEFDMQTSDTTGSAYINLIANQIKDLKIDGSYALDEKEEAYEMEMNFKFLGQKIPIQLVGKKEKAYLSTSFVTSLLDLAKGFQIPIDISAADLKKLDGKYMDIEATGESLAAETTKDSTNPFKNINPASENTSKMFSELQKTLESFDKDSFKKDGDKISHTFTKKEIIELMEVMKKVAKEEKDTASEKEMSDAISAIKETYEKLDVKTTVDTKTNAIDCEMAMTAKSDSEKDVVSITVAFSIQPQKNKQKINLPDKKDILSQDQVNKILDGITNSSSSSTSVADEDVDDQLDELIAQIEANPEIITEETAKSIRESGGMYLNADQLKRLNAALDKALASNAL
ncbi:hypothetical protein ACYSNW_15935 [Enterococcus sp. LJL99]